ncbi:MAG: GAF domain-containing protein [Dehalococcoidia bacterium]
MSEERRARPVSPAPIPPRADTDAAPSVAGEAEFRAIFEAASDGMVIADPDTGLIVEANQAACRMHGVTRDQMLGVDAAFFVEPGSRLGLAAIVPTTMAGQTFRQRGLNRRPDGTTLSVEITGTTVRFRGRTHVLAIIRDVAAQVAVERDLEERVERRTREIATLLDVSREVGATLAIDDLLGSILEHLHNVIDYEGASLLLFDAEDPGRLRVVQSRRYVGSTRLEASPSQSPGFRLDPAAAAWQKLLAGEHVLIPDIYGADGGAESLELGLTSTPFDALAHVRSLLAVPLVASGNSVGVLTVSRSEPRYFNSDHVALARAFAAQASVAYSNAQLFEQVQRKALQNEALAGIAARFAVAEGMSATLDMVCEDLARATGALAANIVIPEDAASGNLRTYAVGSFGHPPGFMAASAEIVGAGGATPIFTAINTGQVSIFRDAPRRILSLPEWQPLAGYFEHAAWDVMVTVPMTYRGGAVGAVNIFFAEGERLPQETLAFLAAVADQAAVGTQNLRLFEDIQRSAREYATLAGVASDLTLDRPVHDTLTSIAETVCRGAGARAASISLLDGDSGRLERGAGHGVPPGYFDAVARLPVLHLTDRSRLFADGRPLVLEHLVALASDVPGAAPLVPMLQSMGVDTAAFLPLVARGRSLGIITVLFEGASTPRPRDLRFLSALANQVSAAVDNMRLFAVTDQSATESAALAAIAANITLGQSLRTTLDTVATSVVAATTAVSCTISIADPISGQMDMVGGAGVPEAFVELARPVAGRAESQRNEAVSTGRPAVRHDVRASLLANPSFAPIHDWITDAPWDTVVTLPVSYGGQAVGALQVGYEGDHEPSPAEWRLLSAISDQLSVAIENARLFLRAERRARENAALAEIARAVVLDQPMRQTLDVITRNVVSVTSAAAAAFFLVDMKSDRITMAGGANISQGLLDAIEANLPATAAFTREAFATGDQIFVDDARAKMLRNPVFAGVNHEIAKVLWEHVLVVPILYRGDAVGSLYVTYLEADRPSSDERALLAAVADQAAVAIQNVSLFQQTASRTNELATLLDGAREAGSTLDVDRLIATLLARLRQVIPCAGISLSTFEPDGTVAIVGQDADYDVRPSLGITLRHGEGTAAGRLLHAGSPIIVADLHEDSEGSRAFRQKLAGADPAVFERTRSWMAVPLMSQARAVGALFFTDPSPGRFDEQQANLALAFGAQASAALENARLFAETNRRVAELETLSAVAESFTTVQPIETTLQNLVRRVTEATGLAACAVTLASPFDERAVSFATGYGLPDGYLDGIREIFRNPAVHTDPYDLYRDGPSFPYLIRNRADLLASNFYEPVWDHVRAAEFETVVLVPIRYKGRTLGALNGYFAEGESPSESHLNLLRAIADQAAVAIESARLLAEITSRAREQEALAALSAAFSYDRPIGEALEILASTIAEQTGAAAVIVRLLDDSEAGGLRGAVGLPEGFLSAVREARAASPEFWEHFERFQDPHVVLGLADWVMGDAALAPLRPFVGQIGADCMVRVPSAYRDRTRANIVLFLDRTTTPPADEMSFFTALAERTAIVLDNARLFVEVQARTNEITALYRADEVLHRSLVLDDVLNSLLEVAVDLLGVDGAALQLWEPGASRPRLLTAGASQEWAKATVVANIAAEGRARFEDRARLRARSLIALEETSGNPLASQERTRAVGIRSIVETGILVGDEVFGLLAGYHFRPHTFSESDRRIFEAVARRAALAIENARLYESARARTEQLAALYRADEDLHRSLLLEDVFDALLQSITDSLHLDTAVLITWDPEMPRPTLRLARPVAEEHVTLVIDALSRAGRQGFLDYLARESVDVVIAGEGFPAEERENMLRLEVGGLVQFSLRANDVGYAYVGGVSFRPRQFSAEEQRLFAALVRRAEVAVENARLYEQAQSLAAIEERQRLARELHDSVSQALYGVALGSRTARTLLDRDPEKAKEPVDYVLSLAEAGLAEMRALIFELRPESLAQEGLLAAIEKQVASTRARYGVAVDATLEGEPDVPLPIKEALYRVAQEALHNVVKHARATHVDLYLGTVGGAIVLDLRDDGQGFDPGSEFPGHLGLKSMRERVDRVGGTIFIESQPGLGAHLRVEIPIEPGDPTG